MKKIVFLHLLLGRGGAEKLRYFLLKNMDRTRYDVTVCCIGKKGELGKEIEALGYKVDELNENTFSKSPKVTLSLIKYLKKTKPDILHSSLFNANFHARIAGFICCIPYIITEEHGEHKQYKGIKFLPYLLADRFLAVITDFIVCCSEKLREDIIKTERLPAGKVVTIENCLDGAVYNINMNRQEIRKNYGIRMDEIVFIMVAHLKADKGHEYLIDALAEIKGMGYGFRCFFVGDGPLKERLYSKCLKNGIKDDIIFSGDIANVQDYLNASDVFLLPSFSEGFSIALMEAMFIGLPCIVTKVGSNHDLINTGFNGTVVVPGDRKELREAIIFYLNNKALIKEYGKRSKAVIETKYSSIDRYVKDYYCLWDKYDI